LASETAVIFVRVFYIYCRLLPRVVLDHKAR